MTQSILIIGAGVAGLSAGCYAQMNGFSSQIFELHALPGGLCTSWERRGYVFDGALRYLTGTHPDTKIHQLWRELDLLAGRQIHYFDVFIQFEDIDGRALMLYTDIDRLEKHLLELAPDDRQPILELTEGLRQFRKMDLPVDMTPSGLMELREFGMDMLPMVAPVLRWKGVTVTEFAARFTDPLIREALPLFFQFSPSDFPMMLLLSTLAMMNDHEAGYPIGGSRAFARDLAVRYETLGGVVHYGARVEEILVENNRAVGVGLEDGTQIFGDIVISAADGHSTIFELLKGHYADATVRHYYESLAPAKSIMQISLGVARDFSNEPAMLDFPLPEPLSLGGVEHRRLVVKHYCFDPSMAPPGKSVLTVWAEADYEYWKRLRIRADRRSYREAKEAVAEQVIAALERRFPGLRETVEVIDVATPITYERYTANWRGAFSGWAMTTKKMSMMMGKAMSKTLAGLEHFYMIGQWVEPAGNVELSIASGRDVLKDICEAQNREFNTSAE